MKKAWKKTGHNRYSFFIDDTLIGNMDIHINSDDNRAVFTVNGLKFIIRRTGILKSALEITDEAEMLIAKVYYEKWYANSWALDFKNKKYRLLVRNNPLAEFAIVDQGSDVLAYGLNTGKGMAAVKITTIDNAADYGFDFLLWYLFLPVVTENMGENFTFILLEPDEVSILN